MLLAGKQADYVEGALNGIVSERKQIFNPAFFYGEDAGVSAVLDRLEYSYRAAHPRKRVCRIKSRVFAYALIAAVKAESETSGGSLEELERSLSDCDLFLMEEFDKVAGYSLFGGTFYSVFNALLEKGSQIVIGAACRPAEMAALEPRVRTQLESGILCCVEETE